MTDLSRFDGHTEGPWGWSLTKSNYGVTLESRSLVVMGFQRWGLGSATPNFQDANYGLEKAVTFAKPRIGKEHHNHNHDICHIDAQLIAAAPALLARVKELEAFLSVINRGVPPNIQAVDNLLNKEWL